MTTIPATSAPRPSLAHRIVKAVGPVLSPMAGRRFFPLWAILEHRGRTSGRVYRTPVVARRTVEGFVIPMAFGEKADWVRNVMAAGGCIITWKGRMYTATGAEAIDRAQAAPSFDRFSRVMMPVLGLERFVRLHVQE